MKTRIAHVCLETTDLETTESFYRTLGASRRFEFRNLREELIGMYMYFDDNTFIELVKVSRRREEGALNHFALQVEDIKQAHQQLVKAGIEATPCELGVDHTWMTTCRDPNGVFIELHQYTKESMQQQGGICHIDYTP